MERPLFGEHISKIIGVDRIVEGINDYYDSQASLIIGRPLDLGRLFYYKLHLACARHPEVTDYEVTWDHSRAELFGQVEARGHVGAAVISEHHAMARSQRIALVDAAIEQIFYQLEEP